MTPRQTWARFLLGWKQLGIAVCVSQGWTAPSYEALADLVAVNLVWEAQRPKRPAGWILPL